MTRQPRLPRVAPLAALTVLLFPLAAHGYVGTAARWMADSYCYANLAQDANLWAVLRHWHNQWTGRFGFNLAESLAGRAGPGLAPWLPPLYLLAWLAAAAWLARGLLPRSSHAAQWKAWSAAALVPFVTLATIPEIYQSVYWTSGLQNYVPPLTLGTLLAGLIVRQLSSPQPERATRGMAAPAACLVVAFAAGGFSESYTGMQAVVLGGLAGLAALAGPQARQRALPCLAAAFVGAAAAALLVATAPGNAIRATQMPPPTEWTRVARIALRLTGVLAADSFTRLPLGMAGAAALAGIWGYGLWVPHTPGTRRAMARLVVWLPLAAGGAIFVVYALSARTLGGSPPGRGEIVPAYVLAWALLAWSFAAGHWLRTMGVGQGQDHETRLWRVVVRLLAAGALVNAAWVAVRTVSTRAVYAAYAAAWDQRHASLQAAAALGAARVAVAPLPSVFNLEEAGADPRHWVNGCLGSYHGLAVVAVPPVPPPDEAAVAAMTPLDARLGIVAQVEGYTLTGDAARAGDTVMVTVFWRPLAASTRPLTVFVHLYDPELGSVAQFDGPPQGGAYPTTAWVYGSLFADTYALSVPKSLPAGARPVPVVGLYDAETLEREAAAGADADQVLNWVPLD